MQFPRPMFTHGFNNMYNIRLCALSLLLDHFDREDQLFAAQYIWWLASIIQFTELLIYYCHYKVFPSGNSNDVVVSPLPNPRLAWSLLPESKTPVSDINNSDTEVHSGRSNFLHNYQGKKQLQLHTTRSGKIFKHKPDYSNSELQARFGKQNEKRHSIICILLKSGNLEY